MDASTSTGGLSASDALEAVVAGVLAAFGLDGIHPAGAPVRGRLRGDLATSAQAAEGSKLSLDGGDPGVEVGPLGVHGFDDDADLLAVKVGACLLGPCVRIERFASARVHGR